MYGFAYELQTNGINSEGLWRLCTCFERSSCLKMRALYIKVWGQNIKTIVLTVNNYCCPLRGVLGNVWTIYYMRNVSYFFHCESLKKKVHYVINLKMILFVYVFVFYVISAIMYFFHFCCSFYPLSVIHGELFLAERHVL